MKEITTELCGRQFSKWAAPRLTGELDEQVEAWAPRSLEEQNYPFLVLWRPCTRRFGGREQSGQQPRVLAVNINEGGQREILRQIQRIAMQIGQFRAKKEAVCPCTTFPRSPSRPIS